MTARFADPFAEIDRLVGRSSGMMPMDAFERDGVYTVKFDVPGVTSGDIDLTVERNMLTVTVERQKELDTEDVNWIVRERPAGRHSRQLRLGPALDGSRVEASYDQGVLTVMIPMSEQAKPQRIDIKSEPLALDV